MYLMKFMIRWWKCLPYNQLERLSCTEVTHRSLLLGSSVKSAAVSVCVLLPLSPLQKTDRLLRICPEERVLSAFILLDAGMQRKVTSRSLPATGCRAASLMGSVEGKSSYFSPWTTTLIPHLPVSWSVGLSHSGSGTVWAAFVWSCAMKIRQDQWERPPAPEQTINKPKLSSPSWKPLCCLWMKVDWRVPRGRLLQAEPVSCTHSPIIMLTPQWEHSCTLCDERATCCIWCYRHMGESVEAKPVRIFFFHLYKTRNYDYLS